MVSGFDGCTDEERARGHGARRLLRERSGTGSRTELGLGEQGQLKQQEEDFGVQEWSCKRVQERSCKEFRIRVVKSSGTKL